MYKGKACTVNTLQMSPQQKRPQKMGNKGIFYKLPVTQTDKQEPKLSISQGCSSKATGSV